ncbi:YfbR-like 5'-deoxynucleotidase [Pseudomonas luteola]
MNKHFPIQDTARSANVNRWHSVPCYRYPSIAEHQYLAIMYGRDLLRRVMPRATDSQKLLLIEGLAVHDLAEVLTGDLATPIKKWLEAKWGDDENLLEEIEDAICPEAKIYRMRMQGTPLQYIAKIADILEAIKFISEEGKHQWGAYRSAQMTRKSLLSLVDVIAAPASEERSNKISIIQKDLLEAERLDREDPINRIIEERIRSFSARVDMAKEAFPELNWSACHDVLNELLNAAHTQIDFIDLK